MRLTGPRLELNRKPTAHCARHALLHMAPKWSSHRTTRAGLLHSRCGHYILQLWFLSSFFLAYCQRSQSGCLPYFHTWCGLSANLECMLEMCCTRLAENTGCQKSLSVHHRTTLLGYIFTTEACIELQPTNGWDSLASLGHPANFNGFRVLASLLHRCLTTEVNKTCTVFGRFLGWYSIYTFSGALAP